MAWNDSFETLVESAVDELGTFLMNRGDLAAYEVARTQEVCRDFCNFLCKDVHKATSQDYAVYLQMHALTPEDEADYGHMLADIRSYCAQSGRAHQAPGGGSISTRRKVITNEIENSSEHAVDMFAKGASGEYHSDTGGSQAFNMRRNSMAFDMRRNSMAIELMHGSQGFEIEALQGAATPPKPLDAVPEAHTAHEESGLFKHFDFSPENSLAEDINGVTKLPLDQHAMHSHGFGEDLNNVTKLPLDQHATSSIPGAESGSSPSFNLGFEGLDDSSENSRYTLNQASESVAIPLNPADLEPIAHVSASEHANELLRGVNGVEYDFSHNSIRKMRDFEKQQRKSEKSTSNAIDYKLVGNFRSFVFERKFVIDTPLPVIETLVPHKTSLFERYLIPLAPTLILFVLAIALSTLHVIVGSIFGILALVMLVFEIPNIKPCNQSTPQSTLLAYMNAQAGRCYGAAMTLIAEPKTEEQQELLFHGIWSPELQWHKAYLARFKSQNVPDFRIPLGSEGQNSLLLLYNNESDYWLVPMVRLENKWYITDPSLGRHTIVNGT